MIDGSILTGVKSMLGIADDVTVFDRDLIVFINSTFVALKEIGLGPTTGFSIEDKNSDWTDFVTDESLIGAIQSYIYVKVRTLFDPPTNSFVLEALKKEADELFWRLCHEAENR